MQIVQKSKQFISILTIIALCFALLAGLAVPARAEALLPDALYMEQSRSGICRLCRLSSVQFTAISMQSV